MPKASPRRRSLVLAYVNGALWGVGSGLASTTMVIYLALQHGASGTMIAWLLAAGPFVGLLRLITPLLIERAGARRRFCIAMFVTSAVVLAGAPGVASASASDSSGAPVLALGACWALYQLLEAMGVVALWAWLGDLAPVAVRGRFIGRREACLTGGAVVGAGIAALATWQAVSYASCMLAGAAVLALAALPLTSMVEPRRRHPSAGAEPFRLRDMIAPLLDPPFRRLLAYEIWFSIVNGLMLPARAKYMASVLLISLFQKKALDAASRGVQALLLPRTGALVDRRGNVPVLAWSQAVIALAPLFILAASPDAQLWIVGAYACWVAYAGVNVALPNLLFAFGCDGSTANYAAARFAWSQLAFSISIMAGGFVLDWLTQLGGPWVFAGWRLDAYAVLFALNAALLAAGVFLARRIPEPPAR